MSDCPDHEHMSWTDLHDRVHVLEQHVGMVRDLEAGAYQRGLAQAAGTRERATVVIARPVLEAAAVPPHTVCYECQAGPDHRGVRLLLTAPTGRYRGWIHATGCAPQPSRQEATHAR